MFRHRSVWSSLLVGLALILSFPAAQADGLVPLVDSYTVSQRFEKNRVNYPEIRWPTLSPKEGQTIAFDLLYKTVDGRQLHMDMFSPAPDRHNHKAVILVHGGAWRSGNKSHFYPLANRLAQRGYVVFTPEYRLSAEAPYPAGLTDLSDAIYWVQTNAEVFGVNPDAIALGGGSSGGHMAALLGFSSHTPLFRSDPARLAEVSAIIDMDGVLDFTTPLALRYEDYAKEKSGVALWVGGSYEQATDLWIEASPVTHISDSAPTTLILSSGQERFTEGRKEVAERLDGYGIANDFHSYENLFHTFWLFEPYVSDVAERIDRFLEENISASFEATDTTSDVPEHFPPEPLKN